jgi:hypothetical protein
MGAGTVEQERGHSALKERDGSFMFPVMTEVSSVLTSQPSLGASRGSEKVLRPPLPPFEGGILP